MIHMLPVELLQYIQFLVLQVSDSPDCWGENVEKTSKNALYTCCANKIPKRNAALRMALVCQSWREDMVLLLRKRLNLLNAEISVLVNLSDIVRLQLFSFQCLCYINIPKQPLKPSVLEGLQPLMTGKRPGLLFGRRLSDLSGTYGVVPHTHYLFYADASRDHDECKQRRIDLDGGQRLVALYNSQWEAFALKLLLNALSTKRRKSRSFWRKGRHQR